MKKILLICTILCSGSSAVFANEILPQKYSPDLINPYKDEAWYKQIKLCHSNFGKIQPDFRNKYTQTNDIPQSKYSNMLSRMEREWLKKEYNNNDDEERVNRLEEKVFGAIHDGDINSRCIRLRKAFDARKSIQAKHNRLGRSYFSGVPTSTPINADELTGY